jgi:hypothetical protein
MAVDERIELPTVVLEKQPPKYLKCFEMQINQGSSPYLKGL